MVFGLIAVKGCAVVKPITLLIKWQMIYRYL